MKGCRGVLGVVAILMVAVVLIFALLAVRVGREARDPFEALPHPLGPVEIVSERAESWLDRRIVHLQLQPDGYREIRVALSLPEPLPDERLPVALVMVGLITGAESVRYVGEVGPNVVIGYDWPLPREAPEGWELARELPRLRQAVLGIPGEAEAVLSWALDQPWADRDRVSLLGFSLGALAAPAVQRLAEHAGHRFRGTVLAYGGAPLEELVRRADIDDQLRPIVAIGTRFLLRPVEPLAHLPHLQGPFLVIQGTDDRLIPKEVAARFWEGVPEPKERVWLAGDHMGVEPHQLEQLREIVAVSRAWLIRHGAIRRE